MKLILMLLIHAMIITATAGGTSYFTRIEIPENVIIPRPGYVPLWGDGKLTWIPENEAVILLNEKGWENIEIIWPEEYAEDITIVWPENFNIIKVENINISENIILIVWRQELD